MLQSYTKLAKKKYKKRPDLLPDVTLIPNIPTPEGLDQEERLDRAILIATNLTQDAKLQLSRLRIATAALTLSEEAEKQNAKFWNDALEAACRSNMNLTQRNDALAEAINELCETLISGVPSTERSCRLDLSCLPGVDRSANVTKWLGSQWRFQEYRDAELEAKHLAEQLLQEHLKEQSVACLSSLAGDPHTSQLIQIPVLENKAEERPSKRSPQQKTWRLNAPQIWSNLARIEAAFRW